MSDVNQEDNDSAGSIECLSSEILDLDVAIEAIEESISTVSTFYTTSGSDEENEATAIELTKLAMQKYPLQKTRCEKVLKLEGRLEESRVREVVMGAEELRVGSAPLSECPICLEDVPEPNIMSGTDYCKRDSIRMQCCGNVICMPCSDENESRVSNALTFASVSAAMNRADEVNRHMSEANRIQSCPLCRMPFVTSREECTRRVQRHAKGGKAWAQVDLGGCLEQGAGIRQDIRQAAYWYGLAAEQGDPYGEWKLGEFYKKGLGGISKSEEEGRRLFLSSASKGCVPTQIDLAISSCEEGDEEDALRWGTLAVAKENRAAQDFLGTFHSKDKQGGNKACLPRAIHWYQKAADDGCCLAQEELGRILLRFAIETYERPDIVGFSAIPRSLHWSRKAASAGRASAQKRVSLLENECLNECAMKKTGRCNRTRGGSGGLKHCKRCRAVAYCGEECQLEHWSMGHKFDCINCSK